MEEVPLDFAYYVRLLILPVVNSSPDEARRATRLLPAIFHKKPS